MDKVDERSEQAVEEQEPGHESEPVGQKHVLEFEGEYVRAMEGKLAAITMDMPEGFARGMHLRFNLEARVRDVAYLERKRELTRVHTFALEEIELVEAFDPNDRPENVGGSASGSAWRSRLMEYLDGRRDDLDIDAEDEEIPDRLRDLLYGVVPDRGTHQLADHDEADDEEVGF